MLSPEPEEECLIPYATPRMLMELAQSQRKQGGESPPHISMDDLQCDAHDLSFLQVEESVFHVVSFVQADLSSSRMDVCDFNRCNLAESNFCMTHACSTIFRGCFGEKANFSSGDMSDSRFERCFLKGATFSSTFLSNARFYGTSLQEVNFDSAFMHGCILSGNNLTASSFSNSNCTDVDFSGANLSRAYFYCTDLTGADMRHANLAGTTMNNVLLSETKFSSVDQLMVADLNQQRQSIALCCKQQRAKMIRLSEDILHCRGIDNWLSKNILTDAPDEWKTLYRWMSNYCYDIPLTDNPPILLLVQWINEFTQ